MKVYVFIETEEEQPKANNQSAIAYAVAVARAHQLPAPKALVIGPIQEHESLGAYGVEEVITIGKTQYRHPEAEATALAAALPEDQPFTLVMSHQLGSDQRVAYLSVMAQSALATGVTALPRLEGSDCIVERGIYTGKAFEEVLLRGPRRILSVCKNIVPLPTEGASSVKLTSIDFSYSSDRLPNYVSQQKSKQKVALPEAEIVISGGRGMKDPKNWTIIEEIADLVGAATACSKPVSDMSWRPHHEHVGQTGIKIAPKLYIAVGISGAVQHIAGISNSKYIVVINSDPEAPFFQIANYGIVGDALDVLPKLKASLERLL